MRLLFSLSEIKSESESGISALRFIESGDAAVAVPALMALTLSCSLPIVLRGEKDAVVVDFR